MGGTPEKPKRNQISIGEGGRFTPDHNPKILEWGNSRNFEPKILLTGMW